MDVEGPTTTVGALAAGSTFIVSGHVYIKSDAADGSSNHICVRLDTGAYTAYAGSQVCESAGYKAVPA